MSGRSRSYYGGSRHSRNSSKSRYSSYSDLTITPRYEKIKDFFRNLVAFMCTQVGVGGLVVSYTLIGAVGFMEIETSKNDTSEEDIERNITNFTAYRLFEIAVKCNVLNRSAFYMQTDKELIRYQEEIVNITKYGYNGKTLTEEWSFPAALMYSLSIITMIGYGNMVPKSGWGKVATVIYAVIGIPLYVLYFMNMGEVLAGCFRWIYTWLYQCSTEPRGEDEPRKRVTVPSTACLWVISVYVLTGAIIFAEWEKWSYLDSAYFCVTSLCKIGLGDLVPGANISASQGGNQTKLVITFVYILVGLGLVAMCYNLMREDVKVKVKEMKEDMGQCLEDTRLRLITCCNKCRRRKVYDDYYD